MTTHCFTRLAIMSAVVLTASIGTSSFVNAEQNSGGTTGRPACDQAKKQTCEGLVQDNILWRIGDPDSPAAKHWAQENLDSLCGCTTDPYETVNCFQVQVNNNHKTWQEAITQCRAKP